MTFIHSLNQCTDLSNTEVIVVDNGSTDSTAAYLLGLEGITVLRSDSNLGVGPAWNAGIDAARGEFIGILNNDILLTPGWLGRLLEPFESDSSLGITGPSYTSGDVVPPNYEDLAEWIGRSWPKRVNGGLVGFCFVLRRSLIEKIGKFDEQFETAYFEDTDYYLRARQAGFLSAVVPSCLVHHFFAKTGYSLPEPPETISARNQGRFARKWGPDAPALPGYDMETLTPLGPVQVRYGVL